MNKLHTIQTGLFGLLILLASCSQNSGTVSIIPERVGLYSDTLEIAVHKMQEYADLENQEAIEDNTIFRIFSMTKPVTAVALMTLFEDGKFQLDDKVSEYIPEFKGAMVYAPDEEGFKLKSQINEMIIITFTQLMPSDHRYAYVFKDLVTRALEEED